VQDDGAPSGLVHSSILMADRCVSLHGVCGQKRTRHDSMLAEQPSLASQGDRLEHVNALKQSPSRSHDERSRMLLPQSTEETIIIMHQTPARPAHSGRYYYRYHYYLEVDAGSTSILRL